MQKLICLIFYFQTRTEQQESNETVRKFGMYLHFNDVFICTISIFGRLNND